MTAMTLLLRSASTPARRRTPTSATSASAARGRLPGGAVRRPAPGATRAVPAAANAVQCAVTSRFIWPRTAANTMCCPQSIDITAIMDELRKVAQRTGLVHPTPPFEHILKLNLGSMKRWGRVYENEPPLLDQMTGRRASWTMCPWASTRSSKARSPAAHARRRATDEAHGQGRRAGTPDEAA